ncbi:PAS domain-containing protein [Tunturiibacter psychrotolerans]|uniref:PAS domain-containing protein n=1 Tax=Tunturiibacter psychrotolerans TaxID=3069686 RepID=UPI003D1C41BB
MSEASGQTVMYDILDLARLPMAIMDGAKQIVCYVNSALCYLAGKSREEMVGKSIAELLPEGDGCLVLLDRVYRTGKTESHTEPEGAASHPFYWSYEIWPVQTGDTHPTGVILQVTETAPFHHRAAAMNEALLLSAVRQHELMESTEVLNAELQAEIKERKQAEAEIEHLAFYDSLTDLPNRRLLMDRMRQALLACTRTLRYGAIFY